MAVVITKRRKAYNVIYTIQNENGVVLCQEKGLLK